MNNLVETHSKKLSPLVIVCIGILSISMASIFFYQDVLLSPSVIPWGSDTLGHVFRFEYLKDSIQNGIWSPDFVPEWYLNNQLFRYYPPFAYYILALTSPLFEDPIVLTNLFIIISTWLGGLSWLLFHKRIGWIPSILAGALFVILPDMVRVSYAEGNLLRHVTNVLLPVILFLILTLLENPERKWERLLLALLFMVLVLSHPMMAAIIASSSVLFIILHTIFNRNNYRNPITIVLYIILGLMLASFWLLPSLTGGITELNKDAVMAGLPIISFSSLFNPSTRSNNIEGLYIGFSLLTSSALLAIFAQVRQCKNYWTAMLTGVFTCLIATPILSPLYFSLPLSTLMWPIRFLTVSSLFFLFAIMVGIQSLIESPAKPVIKFFPTAIVCLLLIIDFSGSKSLIFGREKDMTFILPATYLNQTEGWRQATLDDSRTGSGPSYYVYALGNREQLYGWGFQGARSATLVSSINESMTFGYTAYAIDRLRLTGMDDLWVANKIPQPYLFNEALIDTGYELKLSTDQYDIYHQVGTPRVIISPWKAIGIGSTVQNYAYIFPQIIPMDSPYLDDYSVEELSQYDLIVLAGFNWHNKTQAEGLIQELANKNIKIVIDLNHTQSSALSQQPHFLDVWGERVILDKNPLEVQGSSEFLTLTPFQFEGEYWYTITPQNLTGEVLTTTYLDQPLVVTGYQQIEENKIWFVGLNLAYHTVINNDEAAKQILSDLLGLEPDVSSSYQTISMHNYSTSGKEISFDLYLENNETLLLPFAHFDGTVVTIDGEEVETQPISTLIQLNAPSGIHHVSITFKKPGIYKVGALISILSVPALFATSYFTWRKDEK